MADTLKADLGVLGLAVMGANLARNAARRASASRSSIATRSAPTSSSATMGARAPSRRRRPSRISSAALAKPRIIIIMVKAGKPVDEVIDELLPHLEAGDILIDGGNSLFTDTNRRFDCLKEKNIRFIGMGVSGGEEGALNGPSMMPGGDARGLCAHRADRDQDGGAGRRRALLRLYRTGGRRPLRQDGA